MEVGRISNPKNPASKAPAVCISGLVRLLLLVLALIAPFEMGERGGVWLAVCWLEEGLDVDGASDGNRRSACVVDVRFCGSLVP